MTHPYLTGTARPRVLAHRGLSVDAGAFAENSFAALAAAHASGAAYIESDCHLTRDGQVVLFHDEDLKRVTGDPRRLADVDTAELEDIMADRGGLVTLRQALESFPETRFNIDVKSEAAAEPAGRAVAAHAERVLLTSFSDERRRAALAAAREVRADLVPATSPGTDTIARLLIAMRLRARRRVATLLDGIDAVQVPVRRGPLTIVTPRLITVAHDAGVEVHVWTVNDPTEMTRLVDAGVDGIVTDRADIAIPLFA